ncbi:BI1-like protein [Camellia sinensis]|uniref:BI1-like protein n=1 Tax=Camellia sinensis TaxID=4442 RepID=UPI0010359FF6|nr:BI1-like protein [Camellia sinensis]
MHGFEKLSTTSKGDIEEGTLYPGLGYGENQLRWGFIRKVYGILAAQLVLTTVVSSITVLYPPVTDLLKGNSGLFLFLLFLPLILLWPLYVYQQKHPLNLIILGLFTMCLSLTVGVSCANTDGRIVLEALILTSAVVVSLTGYTFWASKKGKDFSYLGPILFTSLFTLFLAGFIQMFFPLGSTSTAIYGGIGAVIFSGYIVYDTDNLIKRFTYDEHIWASVTLYLDILNLFLTILRILRSSDN